MTRLYDPNISLLKAAAKINHDDETERQKGEKL